MLLSVVIPAYRGFEAMRDNIPTLIAFLSEQQIEHEIILVDDGSDDWQLAEQFARENQLRFYRNPVNRGKGAAVRLGMQHATGDFRIFTDVDVPFQLTAFPQFLDTFQQKKADLVVGDRTLPESDYFDKIKTSRKISSRIFSFIVGKVMAGGNFDTQCGMKGFSANAANHIFSVAEVDSFAFDVELLSIAVRKNYRIEPCAVRLRTDQDGSSVSLLKHAFGMLKDLAKIKRNQWSGKYT